MWADKHAAKAERMILDSRGVGVIGPARKILIEVALHHKLRVKDILTSNKWRPLVDARREAACRIRKELKFSYPQIGRILRMHHTSVMNYLDPKYVKRPKPSGPPRELEDLLREDSGLWAI